MSGAIVTDQFRVSNAENFVNSFDLSTNSYYLFVGLANPSEDYFGRSTSWNVSTPSPKDDFSKKNNFCWFEEIGKEKIMGFWYEI